MTQGKLDAPLIRWLALAAAGGAAAVLGLDLLGIEGPWAPIALVLALLAVVAIAGAQFAYRRRAAALIAEASVQQVESAAKQVEFSALKQELEQQKRLEQQLIEAKQIAEAAMLAKGEFLATMSHEIRTPLNGVLGMAQMLEDRLAPGAEREMAATIRQSGGALLQILNDILDLAKIEAGRTELHSAPFDPAALLERIARLHQPQAALKGVALAVQAGPGLGLGRLLVGDEMRLAQVLHNLVGNALKFTERGAVTITADWTPEFGAGRGGRLRLAVADTGIGMSPEQQARVFEDFVQADGAIGRRYGGTGLGLSISRRLVALMEGTIRVESAEGRGSRFEIDLPAAPATAGARPPAGPPPAPEGAAPATLAGLRVLVAEDNATNQRVLSGLLGPSGVALTIVADGTAAVTAAGAALRGGAPPFDLLLLDIQMPGMDGLAALRAILAQAEALGRTAPPAVALTANVMPAQVADYIAAGFAAHLGKPVRKAELLALVARHAGRDPEAARSQLRAAGAA